MPSKSTFSWASVGLLPLVFGVQQVSAQQTVTIRDTLVKPPSAKVVYSPKATAQIKLKAIYGPVQDLRLDVSLNGKNFDAVAVGTVLRQDGTACKLVFIDLQKRSVALEPIKATKAIKGAKQRDQGDLCPAQVFWTGKDDRSTANMTGGSAPREVMESAPLQVLPLPPSALSKVVVPAPVGLPGVVSAATPLNAAGGRQ